MSVSPDNRRSASPEDSPRPRSVSPATGRSRSYSRSRSRSRSPSRSRSRSRSPVRSRSRSPVRSRSRSRSPRDRREPSPRNYDRRDRSRSRSPRRKPNRLFIGNLPRGNDAPSERDINELFGKYGTITSSSIKDGFAFVEFSDESAMNEAMENEDGTTFRRFQIRVQLSHATSGESSGQRRQPGQGKCFNCQGYGHWARDCTEGRRDSGRGSYDRDRRDRRDYRGGRDRDSYRDRDDRRGGYNGNRDRDYNSDSYGRSSYSSREPGPSRRGREDRGGDGPYSRRRSPQRSSP
mmetsp:Transcript_28339/g.43654  ORF Transcript_28339/g.43654 Transcript_28339/m.43654 type:complete len:292 (-) Transcript_28339:214-1089(-)